jgi:hypothetical protein
MRKTNPHLPQTLSRRTPLALCVGFVCLWMPSVLHAEEVDQDLELIKRHGLTADTKSLDGYLRSLHPDQATKKRLAELIVQLGNDDYFRRETAMAELLRMPVVTTELLQRAIAGDDPEIRWRARIVLDKGKQQWTQVLNATYRVIRIRKIPDLAEPILLSLPLCSDEYLRVSARGALLATAGQNNVALLRKTLAAGDAHSQIATLQTLDHILGAKALADVHPLLKSKVETVRLAAARALGNRGNRDALPALASLLDSPEILIRARSGQLLRGLTGQKFVFVAYDTTEKRAPAVKAWRDWIALAGMKADLTFPVPDRAPMLGRTLICYYGKSEVIELDASGKEIWKTRVSNVWGCHGLPNGHRLVSSYSGKMIIEYDGTGREVWKTTALPGRPFSVRRLVNGNTLAACYDNNKVVEIKPDKSVGWQITVPGRPMDARPLPNGNTLVCLYDKHKVIEIDRAGKIVWEIANMGSPRSAQRLENGNTLVAQTGGRKVVEVDRSGRVIWTKTTTRSAYDAQRLPNGNTLVVDQMGIQEIDPAGKVVWERKGTNVGRVWRY